MTRFAQAGVRSELAPHQHINRILRALGAPQRRAMLHASPVRSMERSNWDCGCTLDVIGDGANAFAWHCCVEHSDLAGGASLVAQAAH